MGVVAMTTVAMATRCKQQVDSRVAPAAAADDDDDDVLSLLCLSLYRDATTSSISALHTSVPLSPINFYLLS